MKKVAFCTLGCKVNQYETNAIQREFEEANFETVDFDSYADVYVINTCTVTGMSDKKSRQMLRRAKKINPNSIVCAIGCYAQVAKEEVEKIEDVDIILGTLEKKNILKFVNDKLDGNSSGEEKVVDVNNIMKLTPFEDYNSTAYTEHVRAEIKIQDGCDRFCSYCIIPYARGPVRSRKPDSIIKEVKELAKSGTKEVVITGIHISSYGKDFKDNLVLSNYKLIDLLEDLNKIESVKRIRLGSLEPRIIDEEFVSRLTNANKVCNHFHLSLQSGCNSTLERMNRKYTVEDFEKIVNLLRNNIPDVALTTDVIVGFPGETDEEFELTKKFLEKIKFSKMHVFKYSKRKGTPAEKMPNQVSEAVKEERSNVLINMSEKFEKEFAEKYIGKEVSVLFENSFEGHTPNYIKVELEDKNSDIINQILSVIPKQYEDGALKV